MKKVLFTGCSYTAGNGWVDTSPESSKQIEVKEHPGLWVNLCHQNIDYLKNLELVNSGRGGASNTEIFEETIRAMANLSDIDIIFCQWTAMPRYNFNVGFELWSTAENFQSGSQTHDINLNKGEMYPRSYINDLLNRFKTLHHLHWEILKVIDYSNIIVKLAKIHNIKYVYFINGLCPWDKNYFLELYNTKPESYTPFTKKEILNIETRNDEDIQKLYTLAHSQYKSAGGIHTSSWLNLYNSFRTQQIDVNFDKQHPGTQSNLLYFNQIKQFIKNKQLS
jgi:hypothetical protein